LARTVALPVARSISGAGGNAADLVVLAIASRSGTSMDDAWQRSHARTSFPSSAQDEANPDEH
jgi:hypothetical protein